jgi:hypothetical protein
VEAGLLFLSPVQGTLPCTPLPENLALATAFDWRGLWWVEEHGLTTGLGGVV